MMRKGNVALHSVGDSDGKSEGLADRRIPRNASCRRFSTIGTVGGRYGGGGCWPFSTAHGNYLPDERVERVVMDRLVVLRKVFGQRLGLWRSTVVVLIVAVAVIAGSEAAVAGAAAGAAAVDGVTAGSSGATNGLDFQDHCTHQRGFSPFQQ